MPPRGGRYPPIKVAQLFGGVGPILCSKVEQDFFRFKLDAMTVPEPLATTICGLAVWLLCYLLIKSPIGAEGVGGAGGGGIQLGMARLESTHPLLFRDSKQNQIHQAARPYNVDLSEKTIFWNIEKKGRNFASGVRFSESARSIFSPRGTE